MKIQFKNKLMDVKTLFNEKQIKARVLKISDQINKEFGKNEPLMVLIVLNGAFIFAADLVRHLNMPTEIETIRLKSYEGTSSTGVIKLLTPLSESCVGKNILIVEDIIETGKTIHFLIQELQSKKAKSIKICTLLNKKDAHESPMSIDYIGFEIGTNFIIGYGLDLDGRYRNLPYIAELTAQN